MMEHKIDIKRSLVTATPFILGGLVLLTCTGWYFLTYLPHELSLAMRIILWAGASATSLLALTFGLRAVSSIFRHLVLAVVTTWTILQEARTRRQTADLDLRQRAAEVRKLEREAELTVITAPQEHQVHISDLNPHRYWQARHLDARVYTNGPGTQEGPTPLELAIWTAWRHSHGPQAAVPPLLNRGQDLLTLASPLPERVALTDLLPGMRGSLRNIILGMRLDDGGQPRIISAPLYRLCHIGVAGATDSGKSNFGRAVAFQVFTAHEDLRVVISDLKATTFKAFHQARRLLYPIVHSPEEFVAVLAELRQELQRRKALFKPYPTVETLADYNKLSDTPLPVIVVFVDEVTNLFMVKETQAVTLEMLREARAFGIYFMALGQSWSHREMNPAIRQQFRTGLHFGTNDPASSRMIVNSSDAVKIVTPGRALASLPFGMSRGTVEIQTPYLDAGTALQALAEVEGSLQIGTPTHPAPTPEPDDPGQTEAAQDALFRQMVEGGKSRREAAREAYGKEYAGAIVTRGKRALGEL